MSAPVAEGSATGPETRPGGRLSLLRREELDDAQRALWDRMEETTGREAGRAGFAAKTADGRLIGPFNPVLRSPLVTAPFVEPQAAEAAHTALPERVRQIVILSVGSAWQAPYELYAHRAVARLAGFSDAAVELLAGGIPSPELADDELLAQRFALALTAGHRIDDALYADAVRRFGEKEIVDLVVLAGCYHTVCGLLNAFAIPTPDHCPSPEN